MLISMFYFCLIFLLCVTAAPCEKGWFEFQDSLYLFSDDQRRNGISKIACGYHDADMVNIETEAENNFIKNHLASCRHPFWIGLNYYNNNFHWTSSGHKPKYTDWLAGEPHDERFADCVAISHKSGYQWWNSNCRALYYYICEKKKNSTSSTTTP